MNEPRIDLPISEMPRRWYNLAGYQAYFAGELHNYPLPPEVIERSLAIMEGLPKPA